MYNPRNYAVEPLEDREGNLYSPNPRVTSYNGRPMPYRSPSDPSITRFAGGGQTGWSPTIAPPPAATSGNGIATARGRVDDFLAQTQGRMAPQAQTAQAGPAAQAGFSDMRGDQRGVMDMLRGWADGRDSVAALAGANATNRAMANQRSMAAGARPGQGAMAMRQAGMNAAKAATDIGAATQQAQIQERQGAAQALGHLATQGRGQDENLGMFNTRETNQGNQFDAGLRQQGSQFNAGMEMDNRRTNDAAWGTGMAAGLGYEKMGSDERMHGMDDATRRYGFDRQSADTRYVADKQFRKPSWGDRLWGAAGSLVSAGLPMLGAAFGGPAGGAAGAGLSNWMFNRPQEEA
jgi:hypothetical protein